MSKKPNMRDVAGEESNPGKKGNPGVVTGGVAGGAVKGDSSESGSNSYAKATQAAVKALGGKIQPFSKYADSQKRGF